MWEQRRRLLGRGARAPAARRLAARCRRCRSRPARTRSARCSPAPTKKRGGTLTVYTSEDFEHLDPGESYFTNDYGVDGATQRTLFAYKPNTANVLSPDLATVIPTTANGGITDGGKTVTVHIHPGVHFSPPVNREVTSADVAYAIERGANPNVANPYFQSYFGAGAPAPLVGRDEPELQGRPDPGHPDARTSTRSSSTRSSPAARSSWRR